MLVIAVAVYRECGDLWRDRRKYDRDAEGHITKFVRLAVKCVKLESLGGLRLLRSIYESYEKLHSEYDEQDVGPNGDKRPQASLVDFTSFVVDSNGRAESVIRDYIVLKLLQTFHIQIFYII